PGPSAHLRGPGPGMRRHRRSGPPRDLVAPGVGDLPRAEGGGLRGDLRGGDPRPVLSTARRTPRPVRPLVVPAPTQLPRWRVGNDGESGRTAPRTGRGTVRAAGPAPSQTARQHRPRGGARWTSRTASDPPSTGTCPSSWRP